MIILIEATELKRKKQAFNDIFQMTEHIENGVGKKPRGTKFPQQLYACARPTMRTYRGDVTSSTCKDCIANGSAIPKCTTCKCQCQTGIFMEEDIIPMGTNKLCMDKLKARERIPNTEKCAHVNFADILTRSVKRGFESLSKSNSELSEKNVLSASAGPMSKQQMPSEEELHSLQKDCPLTSKLRAKGADVREALLADPRKKGMRHSRNKLR